MIPKQTRIVVAQILQSQALKNEVTHIRPRLPPRSSGLGRRLPTSTSPVRISLVVFGNSGFLQINGCGHPYDNGNICSTIGSLAPRDGYATLGFGINFDLAPHRIALICLNRQLRCVPKGLNSYPVSKYFLPPYLGLSGRQTPGRGK